ncbi:MAG TPA: glutamyl-tRNA reductase [Planctomycetota bacterium]|nr:glutamyl-tRNA reductase [Planctomycetota bacterium]
MNGIVVVGLSHKTAPVEVRERCRVEDLPAALVQLREHAAEAAVLQTCNRFEVYAAGTDDPRQVVAWIGGLSGSSPDEIARHCYVRTGRNACKHLFFVASSLDSLVVGETQIRGQVRDAYQAATDAGAVGPHLHALFRAALRLAKEISERTGVGRGNVSVAGAAADLAAQVFGDLSQASVLVVGAGDTADLVMTHFAGRGVPRFAVVNRTLAHAEELAARYGAEAGGLDTLAARLRDTGIWVTAAGDVEPLIKAADVREALRKRRGRPVVAIDLAVPRGIDPAVDALDNVYRYDMAALSAVTEEALRHRRKEFLQCCTLVDAAALRLAEEDRARDAGGTIHELEVLYEAIAEEELQGLDRRLPEEELRLVRKTVHRIVRKLLHGPVVALRKGSPEEHEVIRKTFATPPRREDA